MTPQTTDRLIAKYIEQNIPDFHKKRLESLEQLRLKTVLKRKNPYLFKAKDVNTAGELVKGILDAHLSSQEETIFGGFLENLAIFICAKIYGGKKSAAEGIDLELEKNDVCYIVSIKSGPNWGNSQQINRMKDNFRRAKRVLGTNRKKKNVIAINGCCYGQDIHDDKGDYLKLCGQKFWSFISGIDDLYIRIVKPIGFKAKERNEEFQGEFSKTINRFTKQFIGEFCRPDGAISWDKVVSFNSARTK